MDVTAVSIIKKLKVSQTVAQYNWIEWKVDFRDSTFWTTDSTKTFLLSSTKVESPCNHWITKWSQKAEITITSAITSFFVMRFRTVPRFAVWQKFCKIILDFLSRFFGAWSGILGEPTGEVLAAKQTFAYFDPNAPIAEHNAFAICNNLIKNT